MTTDEIMGLAMFGFWVLMCAAGIRAKGYRDENGRIKTYSAAWWLIIFVVPFGWVWAVARRSKAENDRGNWRGVDD